MTHDHKVELNRYRADAAAKVQELPARIEAERKEAAEEGRQPFAIQPLTEVNPAVLGVVLAKLSDVTGEVADTVGEWRKVCKTQTDNFNCSSAQLLAVLDAAGVKE
jgi:hypothetical protein